MNTDNLIKEVHNDKVLYDIYVATTNAWFLPVNIIAMTTILTGNLEDCMELLENWDGGDYEKYEDLLIDWSHRNRISIGDLYHEELDWDYIADIELS